MTTVESGQSSLAVPCVASVPKMAFGAFVKVLGIRNVPLLDDVATSMIAQMAAGRQRTPSSE